MAKVTINQDSLKSGREWVRHKVNPGSNIFRILPPFGDVDTHNNYPYRRWSIAWLQDPKSNKRRPFATPLTDGDTRCPVYEYTAQLTKYLETKKASMKAKGYDDSDIRAALEKLSSVLWTIKVNTVYAYNAADQSGSVGILELKTTAHQEMKKMMGRYIKDYAQDPTSLNCNEDDSGVWFNIQKDGKGKETKYSVEFNQIKEKDAAGRIIRVDDRSALPKNVQENYDNLAFDLSAIYSRKSYDELRSILLYNIALIAKEAPEAVLPGFEVEGIEVGSSAGVLAKTPPEDDEKVHVIAKVVPTKKITINLSNDDDEFTTPRAKTALKAPTSPVFLDDELDALTQDILGD